MMSLPVRAFFAEALRRPVRPAPTARQRTSAFLRRSRIDGRRAYMVLAVLVTAALALFIVSRFAVTEVVLWPDWSANAARAFILVGPAFATWSAMLASRDGMPNRVDLVGATATSRVRRELGQAALGVVAAIACYGIVVACLLGYATRHATWGGPDVWVVCFGAAVTALYALAGWWIGLLAPGRLSPVVAGGALFLFTVVSYSSGVTSSGLDALQPWLYIQGRWATGNRMFYDVSPYTGQPHPAGGVLIAFGAAVFLIAGYLWARKTKRPAVIALVVGMMLVAPGWALANSTDAMPTARPELIANPPMSCGGEVVDVCLHKAYEAQLDDAVALVDAFYAPLAELPGVPEVVTQQSYPGGEVPRGTMSLSGFWMTSTPLEQVVVRSTSRVLAGHGPVDLNASQHAILTWLAGEAGIDERIGPSGEIDPVPQNAGVSERYQAEVDAAADRFAALSPEEQRSWLEANWEDLRAGELTLEDLP